MPSRRSADRESGLARPFGEQALDLQRGECRVHRVRAGVALVAALDARERLLQRIDRQHAEPAGNAGRELDLADAAGGLAADVVVVVGLTADHGPEADDGLVAAALGGVLGGEGQLERARDVVAVDLRDAFVGQRLAGAGLQRIGELLVEARDAERDAVLRAHRHHSGVPPRPPRARRGSSPRRARVPGGAGCARACRAWRAGRPGCAGWRCARSGSDW